MLRGAPGANWPRALLRTDRWTRRRGDIETNDTSAATDTRQHETTIATATAHAGQHETTIATATAHAGQHETTITTARPQTATIETGDTSATEKHTKNTPFSPAKAMAVSDNRTPGLQAPAAPPAGIHAPTPQKTRMQFDWVKFQRSLKTLQSQRCKFNV